LAEAETEFRDAVALFRKLAAYGGANPENRLCETLNLLRQLLQRIGKRSEAEEVFPEMVLATRKAAERGYPVAQSSLGFTYLTGEGVGKDFAEAAKWFRKAADQGDAC